MRPIILLAFLLISKLIFSQDTATINKLIHFEPIEDTVNGIYNTYAFFYDNYKPLEKKIIIVVYKQDTISSNGQIFVLLKKSDNLEIIDSSKIYERDGRGPQVFFKKDTLRVEHSYHHGGYKLFYTFDIQVQKFKLNIIEMSNVLHENKKYNNIPTGIEEQWYSVLKEELTIKKFSFNENDEIKLKTIQTIKRKLPSKFIPDLAHFVDPIENDVYDKVWN